MSEPRSQGDRYHHGELKRAAAVEAFSMVAGSGAAEVSLRAIAMRLGVTHRALYRHFADREALLAVCAAMGFSRLADEVDRASDPPTFCRVYVRFALEHPNVYALMMSRFAARPAALDEAISRVIQAALRTFGDEAAAKRAWLTLHGGLALHDGGILRSRDQVELETFLIDMVFRD